MRVAVAADHGGAALKAELLKRIDGLGHEIIDLGGDGSDRTDDYPDFARLVGRALQRGDASRGIIVCGSGVGAAVAANKMQGVRACVCHDAYSSRQGVEHDDMNVLCLGGRVIGVETAVDCATAFIGAQFVPDARFIRRLEKVRAIEAEEAARATRDLDVG